jgi:tetratricopeptide (TPR) repeat protein
MGKALACDGDVYDYLIDYGLLFQRLGKSADALKAWKRAVEVNPKHFLGFAFLANLQDEMGDSDGAYANYKKTVTLNPSYYFAWEAMGIIAWHDQRWSEARDAFSQAYKANSANYSYPMMIAAIYSKEKNTKAAREILAQAMKPLDKNSSEYALMRFYYDSIEQGVMQKVLNTGNKNLRYKLLFYLGLYYENHGDTITALKCYEQVRSEAHPAFFEYRLNDWALESLTMTSKN